MSRSALICSTAISFFLQLGGIAHGYTCKTDGGTPAVMRVCVDWEEGGDPEEPFDFTADYTCDGCSLAPEIVLKATTDEWRVWSEAISTGQPLTPVDPANISAIYVNGAYEFNVKIINGNGTDPGAADIGLIDLTPTGDNQGSLVAGSEVEGNVGAITCPADTSDNGGEVNLVVPGTLSGNITCETITSLDVGSSGGGDLTGDVTVYGDIVSLVVDDDVSGEITVSGDVNFLEIGGDLLDDLTVTGDIEDLDVYGSVTANISGDNLDDIDITGSVTGNVTATSAVDLFVATDLTGNFTADSLTTYLDLDDHASGTITIDDIDSAHIMLTGSTAVSSTIHVDNEMTASSYIYISGSHAGDLIVDSLENGSYVEVFGDTPSTGSITVNAVDTTSGGVGVFPVGQASSEFEGVLTMTPGVPSNVLAGFDGEMNGFVNLNFADVAGALILQSGGSGTILKGGAVGGGTGFPGFSDEVFLTSTGPGIGAGQVFSGSATFASVASGGSIVVHRGVLRGDLIIQGAMAGAISLTEYSNQYGDLYSTGEIEIGGATTGTVSIEGELDGELDIKANVSGTITVGEDMDGDIAISGNLSDSVTIGGHLNGDVSVAGDVSYDISVTGNLQSLGRILVYGAQTGQVSVGGATDMSSSIQFKEGLGSGASLVLNANEGANVAAGDIILGQAGQPVDVDGCVRVFDESGTGSYGDLDGDVDIIGCHTANEDVNICVDGSINGTISDDQSGCGSTYTVTHSCSSCP